MKVEFKNDGINLQMLIKADTTRLTRVFMLIFNVCSVGILIFALIDWLLGLFVLGILLTIFSGWLTLTHAYGNEQLTINTKTLGIRNTYGFYTSPIEIKRIHRALNISLSPVGTQKGQEHYNLIFESFNEFELPEEIYRTRLSINRPDFIILKNTVRSLYFERVNPVYLKQTFILN